MNKRKNTKTKIALAHSPKSRFHKLRLVHHRHSGKLVAHRHTSYWGLASILAVTGLIVYTTQGMWATPVSATGGVNLTAFVAGAPPSQGATITSPADGTVLTDQSIVEIDGTCSTNTSVVVSSNNAVVGSTNCGSDGTFSLNAQLDTGTDVLSAKNYDFANQPGPATPDVTVTLKTSTPSTPGAPSPSTGTTSVTSPQPSPTPAPAVVPKGTTPYVIEQSPDQSPCDNAKTPPLPNSAQLKVAVTCLPRVFKAGVRYTIQYAVWGGKAPYAVDVDWGDGTITHTLVSLASATYKTVTVVYAKPGDYTIKIHVNDNTDTAAYVQAAATVPSNTGPIGTITNAITHTPWFNTPVPMYTLAVTLTAGFWASQLLSRFVSTSGHLFRRGGPRRPNKKIV